MKILAASLLALAACGDVMSTSDAPQWTVEHTTTDGAILGIWSSAPDDVWAVGGTTARASITHNDGNGWTPVDVDAAAMLFHVYGFSRSDVYAVGDHGVIVHYDGRRWTRLASGTTAPLFGLWGASGDDVWIVGGDVSGASGSAVVLRGNAHGFAPVRDLPGDMPSTLYKVHGFGPDNVICVGDGIVLRWNGRAWSRDAVPAGPLFSVSGRSATDFYAVGGSDAGEILHSDGTQWSEMFELPTGTGLRSVFASSDGPTIAVGALSLVFEISDRSEISQPVLPELGAASFLHGVWGDGAGTTYVAGSDYPRATTGLILRRQ